MSRAMHDLLLARSCSKPHALDDLEFDPALWWVEFLFYLLQFKKPASSRYSSTKRTKCSRPTPSGIRWHMQALFCDAAKDFRKANISFIFSMHDTTDLDYRLRSKTQYYGYMRGARPNNGSMIPPDHPNPAPHRRHHPGAGRLRLHKPRETDGTAAGQDFLHHRQREQIRMGGARERRHPQGRARHTYLLPVRPHVGSTAFAQPMSQLPRQPRIRGDGWGVERGN